jgi:hypothetical protein
MCWAAQPSLQLVDRHLIRNYIDPATTVERPERDKSRQTSAIRKGSIAPIPARRPPGPLWRDDHRISARAPALRRVRVRAVLGRGRGARPAAEPTHGDATAGQDPRGRRQDAARRQQPRDKGVLSGAFAVRSDLSGVFERHPRLRVAIASSSSWRGRPTCSRRWTTPTASATARRSTGSSTVCLWSLGAHFAIWARSCRRYSGAAEVV